MNQAEDFIDKIILGDCLEVMKDIPDTSIDMILADLPYGTTYASWDENIPMDLLWKEYKRVIKPNRAIVLTATQPFASLLITGNLSWYRHEWVWDKVNATNFYNANKEPLKCHEHVIVFGDGGVLYNPQKTLGKKNHPQGKNGINSPNISETRLINARAEDDLSGKKFPKSIQTFPKHSSQCGLHPTQKPIELFEYLIKTYSNVGDVVLDNAIGSGTTAEACLLTNRHFIGIDNSEKYCQIAKDRIDNFQMRLL